jgi:phytanoyl-CoA hydroxylase
MSRIAPHETAFTAGLREDGYVVMEGVLDPLRDIAPILTEFEGVLDAVVERLVRDGHLDNRFEGQPFRERFLSVSKRSETQLAQHFDFSLPQTGIKNDTPFHFGPAVFGLLRNEHLLDRLEPELGSEIELNPVGHVRLKPPLRGRPSKSTALMDTTPWHQDNGAVLPEADGTRTLTVWIPLTSATIDNGCLQVQAGSHHQGLLDHCPTGNGTNSAIPGTLLDEDKVVTLPMEPGSVLVMDARLAHASLPNQTDNELRISLDLRYQPAGQPSGRPQFPTVLVRSQARPEEVVSSSDTWEQVWKDARASLAEGGSYRFHRWDENASVCA